MKLLKLTPSQRVQGRWLLHLEDGSLLRVGEGEVVSFGLYSGMELPAETLESILDNAGDTPVFLDPVSTAYAHRAAPLLLNWPEAGRRWL